MAGKPKIGITMGDPCGIGPEIIAKALSSGEVYSICEPVVIGSVHAMRMGVELAGNKLTVRQVDSVQEAGRDPSSIDVLEFGELRPEEITIGQASAAGGRAQWEWVQQASRLLKSGELNALAMAPVNSEALKLSGVARGGMGPSSPHMFNFNGPLRVVRLTDHTLYRDVPQEVKKDKILPVLEMIHDCFTRWGFSNPRIAISGLNPHAMGEEEDLEIKPAVAAAREKGINASGPWPPDSVFHQCASGEFDVVLAMTHDQANIAQKTRKLEGIVSIADPLDPYIRVSISHGTAYDIAGKGIANHESILQAIKTAAAMAAGKGPALGT
ncbi:MAG TPA: 4-hydroxythreonine-4-phosphate dehydrogenase PdxA [Dehalococcoidia bacterium]|nr:4-hydroxythreonine-4-phosphate dehydrogenase PdxA [Dehalococcoidia bacterium]